MELTHIIIILLHCFDLRLCPTNNGEIVEIILLLKIVQSHAPGTCEKLKQYLIIEYTC